MLAIQTSISGLQTAQRLQEITAQNVANVQTPGYRALRGEVVESANGGSRVASITQSNQPGTPIVDPFPGGATYSSNVDLATELVGQILNVASFRANAALIRVQNDLLGELLNLRG